MSFDLSRALRRVNPQRAADTIQRRAVADLSVVSNPVQAGPELLLDTCVYIDVLQGHTPQSVDELLKIRVVNHSTVCLAELTHLFGRLQPTYPDTKMVLREIRSIVDEIPGHRLSSPTVTAMGEAGMLAGLSARLSGVGRSDTPALLNDAALYLQALERGWLVLTRNVRDFDIFDQLLPAGRMLFYEQAWTGKSSG